MWGEQMMDSMTSMEMEILWQGYWRGVIKRSLRLYGYCKRKS